MAHAPRTYVLSVPGSDQTRTLSRDGVLGELAKGQITPAYWVWSPDHSDWKQISEFPELQPPKVKVLPKKGAVATGVPAAAAVTPAPIQRTVVHSPTPAKKKGCFFRPRHRVKKDEGFPYVKVVCGLLYALVAAVIAANYLLVDKAMDESLAHTPFVLVPAHAHLGSFVQPDALIIHVLPSSELTQENFAEFLQTLAKSTPGRPFQEATAFNMVALSPAWFSQYALSGRDWKSFGIMNYDRASDRQDFITDHLCNIAGQPLIRQTATMSVADLKAARANVWQDLTAHFLKR